jgi:hypothetical protein
MIKQALTFAFSNEGSGSTLTWDFNSIPASAFGTEITRE